MIKNYYKILEIEYNADLIAVKKAYRRLALKYHPDKNNSQNAASLFIEITEAYEVLKDNIKRQEYNKLYNIFFQSENINSKTYNENNYSKKQNEWFEYGKNKAKEYSNITFDDFARQLLIEIGVGVSYIPNLIAIIITGGSAIGSLFAIPKVIGDGSGLIFFLLVLIVGFAFISYRLILVAKKDYKTEKKIKNFKN